MRLILICAVLVLAGCAGGEAKRAELNVAAYAPYCEKLGHAPNTDAWRKCIQTEGIRR